MKACPYCAEAIQDAAIVCKHCGRDLSPKPVPPGYIQCRSCGTANRPGPSTCEQCGQKLFAADAEGAVPGASANKPLWIGGILLAMVLTRFCSHIANDTAPTTPSATRSSTAPSAKPPLTLLSARGYDQRDYAYVEGQVRNDSDQSLQNVAVHITWLTKDGVFVKTDDALIDFNPILPGQTSSFKSMTQNNPEMTRYRVEFKFLIGGSIDHADVRKQ